MPPLSRVLLATATSLLTGLPAQAATSYRITDLGFLPGGTNSSIAYGINDAGQVVGSSGNSGGDFGAPGTRAFLWTASHGMQGLGDLPGGLDSSSASAINRSGQVIGSSTASTGTRAFRWTARGGMQDLGAFNAFGINDAGEVVGSSGNRAVRWTASGSMQVIPVGDPQFDFTMATGINNVGQVVGTTGSSNYYVNAFLWSAGAGALFLGHLPGNGRANAEANGINDAGQVVGTSEGPGRRAFLWSVGAGMQNLGFLPPARPLDPWSVFVPVSAAFAINEAGQVVGVSDDEFGVLGPRPFLWTAAEGMQELSALIDPLDPLKGTTTLLAARDINNVGQIVGDGTINGKNHAFLLTPVPEPASWALLLAGLAWTGLMVRQRAS